MAINRRTAQYVTAMPSANVITPSNEITSLPISASTDDVSMGGDATTNLTAPSTSIAGTITVTFNERARRLAWLREDKTGERLRLAKAYYSEHWADFINDWGVTVDPRNAEKKLPTVLPFSLWPIQREFIAYVLRKWEASTPGVIRKSRDMGVSWMAMALSCTMCLPDIGRRGVSIGFGSEKEIKVDESGNPDSLFYKGRAFMMYLPKEFRGGWDIKKNSAHMRLIFPETEGSITGEAGDNIGRGGRKSIYFVDEAAHIERPMLIEASLSATTNCRIDMSSVKGSNNPFAEKLTNGKYEVFEMPWRSDPRKVVDPEWEQKQRDRWGDVVFEQEYGGNLNASQEGVICPANWVSAAVNAHIKLGIKPTGTRYSTLDIADRGVDKCAWGCTQGILVEHSESWSGKDGDIFDSVEKAFLLCDTWRVQRMGYDADGMGAAARGDARKINERREAERELARQSNHSLPEYRPVQVDEFRGSASVMWPELWGRGAISLKRTLPSCVRNISTASKPTTPSLSANCAQKALLSPIALPSKNLRRPVNKVLWRMPPSWELKKGG